MDETLAAPLEPAAPVVSERLAILVDVHNLFCAAKLLHQSKVDYGCLLREITGPRQLVRAIAYVMQKAEVNQSAFHEALCRFGYEVKVKELRVYPDQEARGGSNVKGSWQVGMTIDALMLAPKLDTIALVTGDGEYAPLVEYLKARGCRVDVVGFERSTAGDLAKAADRFVPIQENWIFKEKKFEEPRPAAPASPAGAPAVPPAPLGLLGSTAPGQIALDALPRDEEHYAEAPPSAPAAEGTIAAAVQPPAEKPRRRSRR
ncbi:MAG: NYN domain-containing protein [Planctomycetota bacterium]